MGPEGSQKSPEGFRACGTLTRPVRFALPLLALLRVLQPLPRVPVSSNIAVRAGWSLELDLTLHVLHTHCWGECTLVGSPDTPTLQPPSSPARNTHPRL